MGWIHANEDAPAEIPQMVKGICTKCYECCEVYGNSNVCPSCTLKAQEEQESEWAASRRRLNEERIALAIANAVSGPLSSFRLADGREVPEGSLIFETPVIDKGVWGKEGGLQALLPL